MVDILKYPSPSSSSSSFISNVFNLRCKPPAKSITGPIFLSTNTPFPVQDYLSNLARKRWMGRCPGDPPRLVDVPQSPYGIHRRIIHQELSRPVAARIDLAPTIRNTQPKLINRDVTKMKNVPGGTGIATETSFLTIQAQSTRLFNALSKHITVKPEPLRPANNLTHGSTSTLTSWQRYWTSTHVERRRKEAIESEPVFYLPKQQQTSPAPSENQIVVLRDSPMSFSSGSNSNCRTPSSPPSSCSPRKLLSLSPSDDQSLLEENQENEGLSSSLLPSTLDLNSLMTNSMESNNIPLKSSDEDEDKQFTDKSHLFSISLSTFHSKSESRLIEEVADAQPPSRILSSKVHELTVPVTKKKTKKSQISRRTGSKSNENKGKTSSKQIQLMPSNSKGSIKSNPQGKKKQSIATTSTTDEKSWDEPYVGLRFDPPTPPCSPSLLIWPRDDDDSPLERSQIFPMDSNDQNLKSCLF